MTKLELYTTVTDKVATIVADNEDLFKKDKASILLSELNKALELYLAPKKRTSEFEDYTDENGQTWHYCLWHKEYEHIENFATKNNKAVGECKEAVKEWQKYAKAIKNYEAEISNLINDVLDEKISNTEAKEVRATILDKIEQLKSARLEKIDYADFEFVN